MAPKSDFKKSSSANKLRRSGSLSNRIKSDVKTLLDTSKGKLSSIKKGGRPSYKNKLAATGQSASANEEHTISTKNTTRKRRRVLKWEEMKERMDQWGLKQQEDFSTAILQILENLFPDLEITKESIADMNTYINHIFDHLAKFSSSFPLARNSTQLTVKDIDTALPHAIRGDLGKHCIVQGRRAVEKWTKFSNK